MNYDEKLDLILARLTAIENVLLMPGQAPIPQETGGLFDFVRPEPGTPPHGLGVEMTWADIGEAITRACYGVNWRGDRAIAEQDRDDIWAEIDALKAGDEKLIEKYRLLDPTMAGFALLTGLIAPSKHDGITFGVNASKRDRLVGQTVEGFLSDQFAALAGGGGPSGE